MSVILSAEQALSKISTKSLIKEVFYRLDDHLFAPEPRRDNFYNSMQDPVQKQNLYQILRDVVDGAK
jgi:hypothetical protein